MSSKFCKTYKIADITVEAAYNYKFLDIQCKDYESNEAPQIHIDVYQEDIERERNASEDGYKFPAGYLESLAFYRKLSERVAMDDILLFHSAAVEVGGKAYLFTAPSGTGKTTHIALWEKIHGDKMTIINGDKPLLKVSEKVIVYGTPWDGKERQSTNTSAEVAGICILKRAADNRIKKITPNEALATLMSQTYRPEGKENLRKMLQNVVALSTKVPVWLLECNISEEAARTSYNAMSKENEQYET